MKGDNFLKLDMPKRLVLVLLLFFAVGLVTNKIVKADGTYYNIGTSTSNNGSPDSVSWSTTIPIILDSYNNLIVPTQRNSQSTYDLSFSNDKGATWNVNTNVSIPARAAVAYDAVNDTLLTLSADSSTGNVTFDRFFIRRNSDYTISDFTHDYRITPLILDGQGTCAADSAGDPVLLVKNISGTNRVIAFWSVSKSNCSGNDITAARASYLDITNSGTDDDVGSWHTLTGGASAGGNGPANVALTQIYSAAVVDPFYQQSALIKSSGSHINDIYYINIDTNDTHEIRRFIYNGGTGNWSGGVTAPQLFGGDVNNSLGYNPKSELLSKPVESTGEDRVYAGIARWLDGINGDTQSLFYIDSSDTVNLAANVYSAGGAHCIYPTFDIGYDQVINKVYIFYDISGPSSVCGNVEYKTFSGSTLSAATPFYSVPNRSVDIPITYQNRFDGRMVLFFRLNNPTTPGIPPHELYFGYIGSPSSLPQNGTGGTFRDDFTTPNSPYTLVFNDKWEVPASWDPGIFEPKPNGIVNLYGPQGGYLISRPKFTAEQSFEFRASFTQHNFEHIGIANGNDFNKYAIFSTSFDGILKARVADGGPESNAIIGTSYYNGYHNYFIRWTTGFVDFYIDGALVASLSSNIPTGPMSIILSDNDHTGGSDLLVDSVIATVYQPPQPEIIYAPPPTQTSPVSSPVATTTGSNPASFPVGTTQVSDTITDAGNSILNALQSESASKVPTLLLTALGTTYTLAAGTALLSIGGASGGAFGFNMILDILRVIGLLPQKKKKGYVYSTISRDPVYLARIDIKDLTTNRYLGTMVTGFDGAYHVPNLQPGNYVFTAKEPTHRFPTLNSRPTGVAYYDYYKGEGIAVKSNKLSDAIIIPMDPSTGVPDGNNRQRGVFFLAITRILNILLIPTWLLSIIITTTYPTAFNLIITIIYTIVVFFKLKGYLKKPALKGRILNKDNGQPIYGAIVQLKDREGQLIGISRTNKEGYYDFFVTKGNYSIYVSADGYTGEETIGSSVVQVNLDNESEKDINLKSAVGFGVMG